MLYEQIAFISASRCQAANPLCGMQPQLKTTCAIVMRKYEHVNDFNLHMFAANLSSTHSHAYTHIYVLLLRNSLFSNFLFITSNNSACVYVCVLSTHLLRFFSSLINFFTYYLNMTVYFAAQMNYYI